MHSTDDHSRDNFVMNGKTTDSQDPEDPEEGYRYSSPTGGSGLRSTKYLLVGGGVLLVAVVGALMFLSGTPKTAEREEIKAIDARLKAVEEKLAKLVWIDTGMARLDRKEKDIAALSDRMQQLETTVNRRIDQLAHEVPKPPAKPAEVAAKKTESAPSKNEPATRASAAAPAKKEPPKARTHTVQKGETVYAISRKYGISAAQLIKLNKLPANGIIHPGQQLLVDSGRSS